MATYEELVKYLDEYEQQQQQAQQETPYEKMMRERYGPPAQPQQAQRLQQRPVSDAEWNDYLIRHGMQPDVPAAQQNADREGLINNLINGFTAGAANVAGGITGIPGQNAVSNYFDQVAERNAPIRQHDDIFGSLGNFVDFLTDPSGAAYTVANQAGSMAALAPAAALMPEGLVGAGAAKVAHVLGKTVGRPAVNWLMTQGGRNALRMGVRGAATAIPESLSEWGSSSKELERQGDPEHMANSFEVFAKNMFMLPVSNGLEYILLGKSIFHPKGEVGESLLKRIAMAPVRATPEATASAVQNGIEELYQQTASDKAEGKAVGSMFDPESWTASQKDAFEKGAFGSFILGMGSNTAGNMRGVNQQQEQAGKPPTEEEATINNIRAMAGINPDEGNFPPPGAPPAAEMASPAERGINISNEVTLKEFPDAVNVAMNDHSTNPVQRIRNLTGVISHNASDGTNCVRTIGLAYAGTAYGDAINVDQLKDIAKERGQLQDPAEYQPRPGDIAIIGTDKYPDGGHAVVVTENGGTIQNGRSADGVYESEKSPAEMFGNKVVAYIRASDEFGQAGREQAGGNVFEEFAVPENAYSDTAFMEAPAEPVMNEQQEQEAVPVAEVPAEDNAAMQTEAEMEDPLYAITPEVQTLTRDQLVKFAEGVQKIKRLVEAGKMDMPTAIKTRDNMLAKIKGKKVQTAEAPAQEKANNVAAAEQITQNAPATPTTPTNETVIPEVVQPAPTSGEQVQTIPGAQAEGMQMQTPTANVNQSAEAPQTLSVADKIQQAAERFNNDPEALKQAARNAERQIRDMVAAGTLTEEQGRTYTAGITEAYTQIKNRIGQNRQGKQQVTGQGRHARLPMGPAEANAKTTLQRAKEAGIKQKDLPRLAHITRAAMAGNQAAAKQFAMLRPSVQQAMQDIVAGTLSVNDAMRQRNQTPALPSPAETAPVTATQKQATAQETSVVQKPEQEAKAERDQQIQPEQKQQEAVQGKQEEAEPVQKKAPEKAEEQKPQDEAEQAKETTAEKTEEQAKQEETAKPEEETKAEPVKEESKTAEQDKDTAEDKQFFADALGEKLNKLIEDEFHDPEERELASSIYIVNPDDPKGEWANWRKSYRDELNNILEPVLKVLRGGMKQGVDIVRMEGQRDAKYNRVSNNADWYRDYYKEHKRAPKDSVEAAEKAGHITTELEDIAIDVLTGKLKNVMPEYAGNSEEVRAETDKNTREINDILQNLELLDKIRDGVFRIADIINGKPAEQKAKTAQPVKEKAPAAKKKIDDFGAKIGGARKDMYVKGEKSNTPAKPKAEKKTDDGLKDTPWLRDYDIKQGEDGKWTVTDKKQEEKRQRNSFMFAWYNGRKKSVETLKFDTQEAARNAATLDALSEKHTVFPGQEKGKYAIARRIGGRENGHYVTLKDGFDSRDDAMRYMAGHPEEILNMRTSYGESDLPTPVIAGWNDTRNGEKVPERLKKGQNATEKMFTDTFGFRGVQFGNWQNQTERQALMNAAYEGMMDLADVLGVDPKILSLNGELGLAFGARGKGLSGARAHYEMAYTVINLTKLKGAGSLAHEWMHALDHYLMIKSGTIKNDRTEDGRLTDPNFADLSSEVDSWRFKSDNLNPDLLAAYKKLKDLAFYKEVSEAQDEKGAQEWVQRTADMFDKELNKIRQYIAKERQYSAKKKPATAEQLQRFDELATKIAAADEVPAVNYKYHTWTTPSLEALSDLFKEITGRALLKKNPDEHFANLISITSTMQKQRKILQEAQANVEKTKRVPTEYYRNNTALDRGRTTQYWTRPTEMLARAFSSFVEDSVKDRGYTSNFLSFGSDNKLVMWGNPFPTGKERETLNNAFKDFIGEVQKDIQRNKQETGEIKFSIRAAAEDAANKMPIAEQKRQIRSKEELENSKPVFTVKPDDELPKLKDKELRTKAKEIFREMYPETNYRPYSTTTKYGEKVYIPMRSYKELKNHSADNRVMYIVPHLKEILNNSTYLFTPEDGVYKIYGCKAMINGQECYVKSVVRKQPDGRYYYDGDVSTVEDIKNKTPLQGNSPGSKPGIAAEKESYPVNSIPYWINQVNEMVSDPAVADAPDTGKESLIDAAISQGDRVERAVDAVVEEVKDAFKGAKDVNVDGTDVTFTMPNGLKMRVKIKDQIIVSDEEASKARAAHGLKDGTKITVEGSTRKLDNGAIVELSQQSSEGTAYHEAFHTVWDWVLNDKEKAAMLKKYTPEAKAQGKNVVELMADGLKEWRLARAKGKGTLLGKLYQKIQDFINAAKAVLTRTENVHNVFRKIETGDIWSRKPQDISAGNGGAMYSAQEYTSADTSLNQIPAIFKKVPWKDGTINIDIGGGKFDLATDYMKEQGVTNIVFDPFNRDTAHNRKAFEIIKAKGDTVTVANVLNVIKEDVIRENVILQAAKALKPDGTAYFGIYEGDGSGKGKATSKGWQNNRKTADYIAEIAKRFNDVSRKGNMIVAKEPIINPGEQATWSMDENSENDVHYSIREKLDKLANPEKVKYGNDNTAVGRVTRVVSAKTEKNLFQKGMKAIKNLYFQLVDEDTHAHKVDEAAEAKIGRKLSADESFYNQVRETGSISKGHAEALIGGTKAHAETVQSRIRNKALREQFDPNATLQNMMDIIDPKTMDDKYKDYLAKHGLKDWQQALDTYLAANRLKEMYGLNNADYNTKHQRWEKRRDAAQKAGREFTEKEPQPYKLPGNLTIADLDAATKAAPAELEKAAQVYYAFNKNLTVLLADAGLLKPELYRMLNTKYKRYCPLMRDFSDTAAADEFIGSLGRGGDSVVNVSNPLKEILDEGSTRNLLSPLESTIKAAAVYCDRAERNKVGQAAVAMAVKYKLDDLIWRVDGKKSADPKNCIFTVMINGQKVPFQCTQELYEPIVGAPEQVADMLFSLASLPAKTLRYGATISPTFAIRNMIRDTVFAGAASKNGFVPIYDTVRGAIALRKNPELKAKFDAMGISMQSFYGSEMAAKTKLKDLQKFKEPETLLEWAKVILKKPIEGLEWFSEFSEQSTRMGEFMRAIEKGKTLEEAARDARNLTIDFSRHGRTGKKLNQIIPFFNAAVQGGDLMVRLLKNDPAGTMLKLGVYIALPSLALWAMNHDDDWWKELDPDLKNSYWFVKTPGGIVKIPKPQEAGVLFGSGLEALLEQASKRDPEAMKNWANAFRGAITPNYLATVIGPLLENAANYSFFRNKPIVRRANENKPGEMQYTNGTSELSKMLGASPIAHAYQKGGYSPSKIDNLVRGYTGTMGMLLWQGTGEAVNRLRGIENRSPEKKWSEVPFAREFLVSDYSLNRSLNDFYELSAAAEAQHTATGKKGKPSQAVSFIRKARADIAKVRKEIQQITDSKRITPEQKRQMIDKKQEKINIIAKGTLRKYQDKF